MTMMMIIIKMKSKCPSIFILYIVCYCHVHKCVNFLWMVSGFHFELQEKFIPMHVKRFESGNRIVHCICEPQYLKSINCMCKHFDAMRWPQENVDFRNPLLRPDFQNSGGCFNINLPSYQYSDLHDKDELFFIMRILVPGKTVFILKQSPCFSVVVIQCIVNAFTPQLMVWYPQMPYHL